MVNKSNLGIDPRIVEKAQAGDVKSTQDVVIFTMPLVYYTAIWWAKIHPYVDVDDLVQEGVIGVYDTIRKFDPARGKFGWAAGLWITHRIREFCRREKLAQRGLYKDEDCPIPKWERYVDACQEDMCDAATIVEAIAKIPDDVQDAIVCLLIEGERVTSYAKRKGHSRNWVYRAKRNAEIVLAGAIPDAADYILTES